MFMPPIGFLLENGERLFLDGDGRACISDPEGQHVRIVTVEDDGAKLEFITEGNLSEVLGIDPERPDGSMDLGNVPLLFYHRREAK
jgi:hypothetical protein